MEEGMLHLTGLQLFPGPQLSSNETGNSSPYWSIRYYVTKEEEKNRYWSVLPTVKGDTYEYFSY